MLKNYGENIWAVRSSLSMGPMNISTQMSVIRLPDTSLVLISPIAIDNALKDEITALGEVKFILSPNNFHHLFANKAQAAFPQAQYLCSDALVERVEGLPDHKDVHSLREDLWQGHIETLRISPSHVADEVVFYHSPSKTLIVTDILQCMTGDMNLATKLFAKLAGINQQLRVSRLFKMMIKDKPAFRQALSALQQWDYNKLLMPHNSNIDVDAKARVQEAIDAF